MMQQMVCIGPAVAASTAFSCTSRDLAPRSVPGLVRLISQSQRAVRVRTAAADPAVAARPTAASVAPSADEVFTQADFENFLSGYVSQHVERSFFIDDSMVTEGAIPADLNGTLLRNGPGLFEVGDKKIPQPFDGDGLVAMFAFTNGQAYFANRYVRTKGFLEEQEAGRLLYRGAFSVGNPSGGLFFNPFDISVKGVANTGIVHWGSKLLALYERDLPYELTTPELKTLGQTVSVDSPTPFFGAHYRVMREADGSQRLVAFNASEALKDNIVHVWEYDEQLNRLHTTRQVMPDASFGFFHDFVVTENYYVFLENPVRLDMKKMLLEYMFAKACIAECLKFDPGRPTKIHLIPRPGKAAGGTRVLETSPFFSFHHGNAFETADGRVVIDTVGLHDGMDFSVSMENGTAEYFSESDVGRGTLTRLVADPRSGTVQQHRLVGRAAEFPSVAPAVVGRPHSHIYMGGAREWSRGYGALQVVSKVSLPADAGLAGAVRAGQAQEQVYSPGRDQFCQEPIFVPRPNPQSEDDGYVCTLVFDASARRTRLDILDARSMQRVCAIALPHRLPLGLHGSWTDAYLGPDPAQRSAYQPTEYDIRNGPRRYA